jgi:hypothetical protein
LAIEKFRRAILATALLLSTGLSHADAWLDAGDSILRSDLQYLVDSNIIRLPVNTWPIPSNDVVQALADIRDRNSLSAGQVAALDRLERRLAIFQRESVRRSARLSAAAKPALLRAFESTPREEGEVGATLSAANRRFSARVAIAVAANPGDDKQFRLDGSYLTTRLGNWLLTAGSLEQWWGPGWDGSLILSNNARPVPGISLTRESSAPFQSRWLRWIGPWRLSTFMGKMESDRIDVSEPLLFGMRVTAQPLKGVEIALSRSAQFCGKNRKCDTDTFRDILLFDDTAGFTVSPEDEPGNQLAGWDIRAVSPWKTLPLAVYWQEIGEDRIGNRPTDRLRLFGVESWHGFANGGTSRVHVEYSDTTCAGGGSQPVFDCAYNHHIFFEEGYRYRDRPIAHSADGDARIYSLGVQFTAPSAWNTSMSLRHGRLNEGGGIPDLRNTVATEPTDIWDLEAALRLPFERGELRLGVGFDQRTPLSTDISRSQSRGFIEWRQGF